MKNYILLLGLLLKLNLNSFSQPDIGIIAGPNFSYQYYKSVSSAGTFKETRDMIVGFHAGIISDLKLSKKLSLQPSIQFSRKGSTISRMAGINNDIPFEQKTHLNYIEIVLPFHYKASTTKHTIFIGAGPAMAYGISAKQKDTYYGSTTSDPFKNHLKRFDAGIILQSGIRRKSFQASAEYNHGLYNFIRNEYPWVQNGADVVWKNRTFSLSVAYFWKLKK